MGGLGTVVVMGGLGTANCCKSVLATRYMQGSMGLM